jgi:UDP-3-O-[3-hydroxymyristoyl] glucosamine N-acyltransferase
MPITPRPITLSEVAQLVKGELRGDGAIVIEGVGPIEEAGPGQIAALDSERFLEAAKRCGAAALLVPPLLAARIDKPCVVTPVPQIAQNALIDRLGLWRAGWLEEGIHESAVIDRSAELAAGVAVGALAVVGPRARIGAGTRLHPHAVICAPATLGDDCVVLCGAVIGGEGFGFGFGPTGAVRIRHLGRVVLGNRVEVGNHVTIDRARFGATSVGDDVKLDSHVHLGHNVSVGARTIFAAQGGVAGSTRIGENCLLGAQVGVADHVEIASGARLAAKSGVASDIKEPGDYFGLWAKERRVAFKELIALGRLPEALKEIERLRRELDALRSRLAPGS